MKRSSYQLKSPPPFFNIQLLCILTITTALIAPAHTSWHLPWQTRLSKCPTIDDDDDDDDNNGNNNNNDNRNH